MTDTRRKTAQDVHSSCPCPKVKCERHGNCEVCATHHTDGKSVLHCQRK